MLPLTPHPLAIICAITAAILHWAAITAEDRDVPTRVLVANMVASAAGGAASLAVLELMITPRPLLAIAVASMAGHLLGPLTLWWLSVGLLQALAKHLPWLHMPDVPPPRQRRRKRVNRDQ